MVDADFRDDKAGLIVANELIADPHRTHCQLLCCKIVEELRSKLLIDFRSAHYIHCYVLSCFTSTMQLMSNSIPDLVAVRRRTFRSSRRSCARKECALP